jgi:hypothetical protein
MSIKKWLVGLCIVIFALLSLSQLALRLIPDLGAWMEYGPDVAFNTASLTDCVKLAIVDLPGAAIAHSSLNGSYVTLETPLKSAVVVVQSSLDPHFADVRVFGRGRWIVPIDRPSALSVKSTITAMTDAIARRCQ